MVGPKTHQLARKLSCKEKEGHRPKTHQLARKVSCKEKDDQRPKTHQLAREVSCKEKESQRRTRSTGKIPCFPDTNVCCCVDNSRSCNRSCRWMRAIACRAGGRLRSTESTESTHVYHAYRVSRRRTRTESLRTWYWSIYSTHAYHAYRVSRRRTRTESLRTWFPGWFLKYRCKILL